MVVYISNLCLKFCIDIAPRIFNKVPSYAQALEPRFNLLQQNTLFIKHCVGLLIRGNSIVRFLFLCGLHHKTMITSLFRKKIHNSSPVVFKIID